MGDVNIIGAIVLLFELSYPSDIARFIIPSIINPIDHKLWSVTLLHVFPEVRKYHPSLANYDSAFAVVTIIRVPRICASLQHGIPDSERTLDVPMNGHPVKYFAHALFIPQALSLSKAIVSPASA